MASERPDGLPPPILNNDEEPRAERSATPETPFASHADFSVAGTVVSTVLVAVVTGMLLFSPGSRIEALDRPEEDLERIVSREMDVRHALETAPAWERALERFLAGGEDTLEQAIRWYDDLAQEIESPQVQLYRVILLAEAGQENRVSATIIPWEYQGEVMAKMLEWVRAAYLGEPPDPVTGRRFLEEVDEELSPGWFADILKARIASAMGDRAAATEALSAILSRGSFFLERRRALEIGEFTVLVVGSMILVLLVRRHPAPALGTALIPAPWGVGEGYALFIRGVLGFLIISGGLPYLLPNPHALSGVITLLAGAPILWLSGKYLAARGLSLGAGFGLQRAPNPVYLSKIVVALVALSLLGELTIVLIVSIFDLKTDWTDGLLEDLLWGLWWVVVGTAVDSIVWAPVVEEVAFRGILYGGLRTTMGVVPAALLSAGTFAVAHGYGMIGLVSVFWSGIIWAIAYERTRSLWPAIVAHGVNNLMVTTEFLWLYR